MHLSMIPDALIFVLVHFLWKVITSQYIPRKCLSKTRWKKNWRWIGLKQVQCLLSMLVRPVVATPIKTLMFDCQHLQPSCSIHVEQMLFIWVSFGVESHTSFMSMTPKQSTNVPISAVAWRFSSSNIIAALIWTVLSTIEAQGDIPSIWHWWSSMDDQHSCALLGISPWCTNGKNQCHDDHLPDILQGHCHRQWSCHHHHQPMTLMTLTAFFISSHPSKWETGGTPWQQGDDSSIQHWLSLEYDVHSCALPDSSPLPQQCSPSLFSQWQHPVGRHPVKALSCTKQGMQPPTSFCQQGSLLYYFLFLPFCFWFCAPSLVFAVTLVSLCVLSSMVSSLLSSFLSFFCCCPSFLLSVVVVHASSLSLYFCQLFFDLFCASSPLSYVQTSSLVIVFPLFSLSHHCLSSLLSLSLSFLSPSAQGP